MSSPVGSNNPPRGRDIYNKYRSIIEFHSRIVAMLPLGLRRRLVRYRQNSDSKLARLIRFNALKSVARSCGDLVDIHSQCTILNPEKLSVGSRVSIHPVCYIDSAGGIEIGSDVSIAHHTTIMSSSHTWADPDVPIRDQPVIQRKTSIKNNVWIGAGVRILGGVTVGEGSIIAAGAVVTKDVLPGTIVAGVPAKFIRRIYNA